MKKQIFFLVFTLLFFISCTKNSNQSSQNVEENDTLETEEEPFFPDPEVVFIVKETKLTDKDIDLLANYECNDSYSRKVEKLYCYGYETDGYVYFTSKNSYDGFGELLYANFLTKDWCQNSKFLLRNFILTGEDSLISVFKIYDDLPNPYLVCISKTITQKINGNKPGYYMNMYFEDHGNSACYIEEVTPQDDVFNYIMSNVHNYHDFLKAWDKYKLLKEAV